MDTPEEIAKLAETDPELVEILKHMLANPDVPLDLSARRQGTDAYHAAFAAAMPAIPSVAQSTLAIPMRDGHTGTSLLFQPRTPATSPRPLIVCFFGGGFVLGSPANLMPYGRALAALFDAVFLAADYRLAPEHAFPTAVHDAWDALQWAAANAAALGADPVAAGFVVAGMSAGANLAAVVAQRAKDEGLTPALTAQWLCIPLLLEEAIVPERYRARFFAREQCADGPMLDRATMEMIKSAYAYDVASPLFSPVNAASGLAGLPRAFVQVCGKDPLRDDGLVYEALLKESGVETRLEVYPGVPHAAWSFFPMLAASQRMAGDMARGMGWLLGRGVQEGEVERVLKLPEKVVM